MRLHTHTPVLYSGGPSQGTLASAGEWGEMLYPTVWHLRTSLTPNRQVCLLGSTEVNAAWAAVEQHLVHNCNIFITEYPEVKL